MTKKVFDNAMVAHVWAQQSQSEGRSNNGNFHFDGPVLYSYNTPIGNIVKGKRGPVALLSSYSYSPTTSVKHLGPAGRAVFHIPHFYVPALGVSGGRLRGPSSAPEMHKENLVYYSAQYIAMKAKLEKARTIYGLVEVTLQGHAENVANYCDAFGLKMPKFYMYKDDAAEIMTMRALRDARNNTPAKVAARKRDSERKAAKVRDRYRAGESLSDTGHLTYRAERHLDALMTDDDRAARGVAIQLRNAEKIAAWFAGGPAFRFDAEGGGAALRVIGEELQTSHEAAVPLAHAVKAFRFLKLCRERGRGWEANGHKLHVGHFTITSVAPNGDFRAGCHQIKWAEVERLARQIGVFDQAPADAALSVT